MDLVRVQGQIFKFKNPLYKFETGNAGSFKFGIWIAQHVRGAGAENVAERARKPDERERSGT